MNTKQYYPTINHYPGEFNKFFKNATKALNIGEKSSLRDKSEFSDPVNMAF